MQADLSGTSPRQEEPYRSFPNQRRPRVVAHQHEQRPRLKTQPPSKVRLLPQGRARRTSQRALLKKQKLYRLVQERPIQAGIDRGESGPPQQLVLQTVHEQLRERATGARIERNLEAKSDRSWEETAPDAVRPQEGERRD